MRNEIYYVDTAEMVNIMNMKKDNTLVVEIDGGRINCWEEFHKEVADLLGFPLGYEPHSVDAYLDWMRDFTWYDPMPDAVVFVIWHYRAFMKDMPDDKKLVIELFEEYILPFWESEVEKVVVEGKAMPFNVYLVE